MASALDFDTPVSWARRSSDFVGICSSLVPMSSNFSVSTEHFVFFFLSSKSPFVLSVFTQLWIVCLLGTLSSWNFHWHFLADQYFTWVIYREIHVALQYSGDGVANNRLIVPALGDYDDREIGGMMIGKGNRSTRRKPAPVPLCPPQTRHGAQTWTRAAVVGS
jgi:hypothetical protein